MDHIAKDKRFFEESNGFHHCPLCGGWRTESPDLIDWEKGCSKCVYNDVDEAFISGRACHIYDSGVRRVNQSHGDLCPDCKKDWFFCDCPVLLNEFDSAITAAIIANEILDW